MEDNGVYFLILAMRSLEVIEYLVIKKLVRIEMLIILAIFWVIFYMKFGDIIKDGLEQRMSTTWRIVVTLWVVDPTSFGIAYGDRV